MSNNTPVVVLNPTQLNDLQQYSPQKKRAPKEPEALHGYVVDALNGALVQLFTANKELQLLLKQEKESQLLLKQEKAKREMQPLQDADESLEAKQPDDEGVADEEISLSPVEIKRKEIKAVSATINDVLSVDQSLAPALDIRYRPEFLHQLNAEQQAWVYSQLPSALKYAPLTESLIIEAFDRFFVYYQDPEKNSKANPEKFSVDTANAILDRMPAITERVALLQVKRSRERRGGSWLNDYYHPAQLQTLANKLMQGPLRSGPISFLNTANIAHSDLYSELTAANIAWLEKLSCPPLATIHFKRTEPEAITVARAKLKAIKANEMSDAWQHIGHSATLTRLALEPVSTQFWSLFVSGIKCLFGQTTTLQETLTASQLLSAVKDENTSFGVRVAIQNAVKQVSWWEKTLNNWGIPAGVTGKFTQEERDEIAALEIKAPAKIAKAKVELDLNFEKHKQKAAVFQAKVAVAQTAIEQAEKNRVQRLEAEKNAMLVKKQAVHDELKQQDRFKEKLVEPQISVVVPVDTKSHTGTSASSSNDDTISIISRRSGHAVSLKSDDSNIVVPAALSNSHHSGHAPRSFEGKKLVLDYGSNRSGHYKEIASEDENRSGHALEFADDGTDIDSLSGDLNLQDDNLEEETLLAAQQLFEEEPLGSDFPPLSAKVASSFDDFKYNTQTGMFDLAFKNGVMLPVKPEEKIEIEDAASVVQEGRKTPDGTQSHGTKSMIVRQLQTPKSPLRDKNTYSTHHAIKPVIPADPNLLDDQENRIVLK